MERLLKPSLAFGSLCLLIYMFPQKAFYITVFSSGVILTVIIELIVFYFYLDRESDGFDEVEIPKNTHKINIIPIANEDYSPRPSVLKEKSNFLALSDVLGLERRMSGLPCVCNSPEFAMLCSGGEVTINELIGYMKDLYLVEKSYGNALVKLCDASFLDKFKKKSSDILSKFKETLKSIGKAHLDEAEFLDEALLENLGTVEKEIKHQYKEIVQKLKTSSKDFENTVHNIQKLQTKLINSESNLNRASNDYEDGKKELVPYDVLMKKEMKLKLTKNEVSTLKNTIKQYKDNMESESKVYLPKAVEILDQLKKFKQKRADVYRSNIQSWLGSLENCTRSCTSLIHTILNSESESTDTLSTTEETKENFIDKLTQKVLPNLEAKKLSIKGMWNKTIHKKTDVNQEIFEKLDGKVKKIRKKFSEIDVFVKNIGNNETNYGNELMRVINGWHELEDLGLADRWKEVSHGLEMLNESIEKYITESDEARSELRTFELKINDFVDILSLAKLNPDLIENTHIKLRELKDIRDTMVETCKGKLIKSMATRLQDSLKYVSSVINFMDDTEEVDIIGNFSSLAKIHRYQCPFYIYEVESSNDPSYTTPETIKIGSPETAYWFNDLLTTYIFEWAESPKFQTYISRRLKKIYNKDRPQYIGEIQIKGVELGGQAPEVKDFTPLAKESDLDFFYEFDLWFRGEVRINLEFVVQLSLATMTVNVKVIFRSLYGRMLLFFTPSERGKSWYSFVAEPAYQISIEPVLGKMNKVALSKFPQLNTFLVSILSKKIRKYVWPNKRSVKIPKGKKIPKPKKL